MNRPHIRSVGPSQASTLCVTRPPRWASTDTPRLVPEGGRRRRGPSAPPILIDLSKTSTGLVPRRPALIRERAPADHFSSTLDVDGTLSCPLSKRFSTCTLHHPSLSGRLAYRLSRACRLPQAHLTLPDLSRLSHATAAHAHCLRLYRLRRDENSSPPRSRYRDPIPRHIDPNSVSFRIFLGEQAQIGSLPPPRCPHLTLPFPWSLPSAPRQPISDSTRPQKVLAPVVRILP